MRIELLTVFPAPSVKASIVTRARVMVDTITSPGYPRRVAWTLIWQSLEHEVEPGLMRLAVGAELMLGVTVCKIVVGTRAVVVIKTDDTTNDTMVDAGIWLVITCVDPGCVKVLVVTWPGTEIVDIKLVVTVRSGSVIVDVKLVPGTVSVIVVVIGGITRVLVMVDKTVLAGRVSVVICVEPGIVDVITLVDGGSTIVDKEVEMDVETLV